MSTQNRMAGTGGVYFCEVTTAHTSKTFHGLLINSDAVFTTLTITDSDGTTYNALLTTSSQYGQNLAARTVKQGTLLTAPEGSYYSALTMSSGDCIGIITRDK